MTSAAITALKAAVRDYATEGLPSSGDHDPVKSDIRDGLDLLNTELASAQSNESETVTPEDFPGATDTIKFQAALDSGKAVRCKSTKSYTITGKLSLTTSGQVIDLNGCTIDADGSFDVFEATDSINSVTLANGIFEGDGMTGGYWLSVSNADRINLINMRVHNPYNFLYVEEANVVHIENCWANNIRGDYGIHWYGDATKRSDILRLIGVNMSFPDTGTAIEWNGDCNTLQAQAVTIVRPNIGIRIRNTTGGSIPTFGFFDDVEIDFPQSYGVQILAGEDFYFSPLFYCHGSVAASGVYIGSSVVADRVVFTGGKITSHATYGIENNVRVMASNLVIFNNTTADFLTPADVYIPAERFELDGTGFFGKNGVDPIVSWDSSDYDGYVRSSNVRFMNVGGTARFQASNQSDAIEIYVGGQLQRIQAGANNSGGTGFRALIVPNV